MHRQSIVSSCPSLASQGSRSVRSGLVLVLATLLISTLLVNTAGAVEVEVIEGQPDAVGIDENAVNVRSSQAGATVYRTPVAPARSFPADTQTELLLQLQSLQDEVRMLRGQVEEQAYQLQRLQAQSKEDYVDIDRRLNALQAPGAASRLSSAEDKGSAAEQGTAVEKGAAVVNQAVAAQSSATRASTTAATQQSSAAVSAASAELSATDNATASAKGSRVISTEQPTAAASAGGDAGRDAYKAAYELVKTRDFEQARVSMVAFVADYPDHQYVPNAHFWLGELYYHDSDLPNSKNHFAVLIDNFPSHRKVPDAKFKLAKVEHQLGDSVQATLLLRSVINDHSGSRVAKPAREYLKNSL